MNEVGDAVPGLWQFITGLHFLQDQNRVMQQNWDFLIQFNVNWACSSSISMVILLLLLVGLCKFFFFFFFFFFVCWYTQNVLILLLSNTVCLAERSMSCIGFGTCLSWSFFAYL